LDWEQIVRRDFDDTDNYLIDPARLFAYLYLFKKFATWNLGEAPLTKFQEKYLNFYDSLNDLYQEYHRLSMEANKVSTAMAARWLAENQNFALLFSKWDHIILPDFMLIHHRRKDHFFIEDLGKAEVFYDADSYYLENQLQEAVFFFVTKSIENAKWIQDRLRTENRKIKSIGVAGNVSQVMKLQQEIEENSKLKELIARECRYCVSQ
jgi:hypothetical protein